MTDAQHIRNLLWLIVSVLEVLFFAFLLVRRFYRSHPIFFLYAFSLVLQTATVAMSVQLWGDKGFGYWYTAWISQALVIGMRWSAIAEITRKILGGYSGIWRLANVVLFVLSIFVLVYALWTSHITLDLAVLSADRGVELCIAVFVVVMFGFARYYRLPVPDLEKQMAIGFCLYSCAWVVNDTIVDMAVRAAPEKWAQSLGATWDLFLSAAFIASLTLWTRAIHVARRVPVADENAPTEPVRLTSEHYARLSEEVSSRLTLLNHRLNHLLGSKDSRP